MSEGNCIFIIGLFIASCAAGGLAGNGFIGGLTFGVGVIILGAVNGFISVLEDC